MVISRLLVLYNYSLELATQLFCGSHGGPLAALRTRINNFHGVTIDQATSHGYF
jgi:hypothetical protein